MWRGLSPAPECTLVGASVSESPKGPGLHPSSGLRSGHPEEKDFEVLRGLASRSGGKGTTNGDEICLYFPDVPGLQSQSHEPWKGGVGKDAVSDVTFYAQKCLCLASLCDFSWIPVTAAFKVKSGMFQGTGHETFKSLEKRQTLSVQGQRQVKEPWLQFVDQ